MQTLLHRHDSKKKLLNPTQEKKKKHELHVDAFSASARWLIFTENPAWHERSMCRFHLLFTSLQPDLLSSSSPPCTNGPLLSDKSMKIWVKYGGRARWFLLAVEPCSVSSVPLYLTHIPITVNGLLLQLCLCQFRGWDGGGAPAGMTEGREYAMQKTFWQTAATKPYGRYYRYYRITELAETLTKTRSASDTEQKRKDWKPKLYINILVFLGQKLVSSQSKTDELIKKSKHLWFLCIVIG